MVEAVFTLTDLCNFNCSYCLLLKNNPYTVMSLDMCAQRVSELEHVDKISLMGGELGLLDDEYLDAIIKIIEDSGKQVGFITNLSIVKSQFLDEKRSLQISLHLDTDNSKKTLANMFSINRSYTLNIVATEKTLNIPPEKLACIYNAASSVSEGRLTFCLPNQDQKDYPTYVQYLTYFKKIQEFSSKIKYTDIRSCGIHVMPNGDYTSLQGLSGRVGYKIFSDFKECEEYWKIGLPLSEDCLKCTLSIECDKKTCRGPVFV